MDRIESRRGRRRRLTRRVALRRRHIHLSWLHPEYLADPSPANVDCVCETSAFYFAKRPFVSGWPKRIRGRPKIGRGYNYPRWSAEVRWRSKRLARDLTSGRVPYDWAEPGVGFYGVVEMRRLRGLRWDREAMLGV